MNLTKLLKDIKNELIDPNRIDFKIQIIELINSINFDENLVLNKDVEKLKTFIGL